MNHNYYWYNSSYNFLPKGTSHLDQSVIDDILKTAKGSRPNPSTYLPKEYITKHLSNFDEGMSKFAYGMPKYPDVGHPSGHFVMPKCPDG